MRTLTYYEFQPILKSEKTKNDIGKQIIKKTVKLQHIW